MSNITSETTDRIFVRESNPDVIEVLQEPSSVVEISTSHAFIPNVTISAVAPPNPQINDVWIDISNNI